MYLDQGVFVCLGTHTEVKEKQGINLKESEVGYKGGFGERNRKI